MPTPNAALARQVLGHIEAHPQEWNQGWWAYTTGCGTSYCFAGHAVVIAHPDATFLFGHYTTDSEAAYVTLPGRPKPVRVDDLAQDLLGLTTYGAGLMFEPSNTFGHLREYVAQLEQPDANGSLVCVNPLALGEDDDDD